MADIQTYLDYILSKVYGKDVRQAIVDAINQCYTDATAGITPVITTEQIAGGTKFTVTVGSVSTSFDVMNGISPQVATANTASAMTDTDLIYIYTGSETGYVNGDWYYYDGTAWQDGGQYQSTVPAIDSTLTVTGAAADAKATGDEIGDLRSAIQQGGSFNAEVKAALDQFTASVLQLAEKVAYVDANGQDYYDDIDEAADALHTAMYPPANLSSISAVYTQSGTVYTIDSLDSLKSDLVVTAHYSDSTTATVTNYVLSGTLTAGTSTITVAYGGKTTTFNVTVTEFARNSLKLSDDDFHIQAGSITWDSTHDINTNTATSATNGRKNIYIDAGVKPYFTTTDNANYSVTNPPQYPIPIPSDATSCTYTITPNTQFMGAAFYTYDENTGVYTRTDDVGWKQGSYTFTFTAGSKHYMTIATKYNSSGSSYPTAPTEMTITFE